MGDDVSLRLVEKEVILKEGYFLLFDQCQRRRLARN